MKKLCSLFLILMLAALPIAAEAYTYYGNGGDFSGVIGGSSTWDRDGDDIYYNSGNVGIATTEPTAHLDVDGTIQARTFKSRTVTNPALNLSGSGNDSDVYVGQNSDGGNDDDDALEIRRGENPGDTVWTKWDLVTGYVGIGTTAPTSRLTVSGTVELEGVTSGIKFPDDSIQTTAATTSAAGGSSGQLEYNNAGDHGSVTSTVTDGAYLAVTGLRAVTEINDTNANQLLTITATGSAVNNFGIANGAAGNGPTISAVGDDTNVDINYTAKGTGSHNFTSTSVLYTGEFIYGLWLNKGSNATTYANLKVEGDTDANLLVTDAANNRVGVGTSVPTAKFQVVGGMVPGKVTADPCAGAGYAEGAFFYNDTSNVPCFCDGTNDLRVADGAACF